jgi:DNA-binding HxlR family transcriptional regulator
MVAKSSALKHRKHDSKDESGRNFQDARTAKPRVGAPEALDRLIHERLRLGIVSALAANESLTFNDLKNLMHITDGNLSVHARKLEDAGYISCSKYFDGRVPKTEYKLTGSGRRALESYLSHMESLIKQMRAK